MTVSPTASRMRVVKVVSWVLALVAALTVLWAWAVSAPIGSSPDDDLHLASIWCKSSQGSENCVQVTPTDPTGEARFKIEDFPTIECFAFQGDQDASCLSTGERTPRMSIYLVPPLFYEFSAVFAGSNPSEGVMTARFATMSVIVLVFALAYAVSLPWLRGAMIVSWVLLSIPLGVSLFASNNPSGWGIAGLAAMWGPMVSTLTGTTARSRWFGGVGWIVAGTLASGARGDAALFVILVSALGLVLLLRRRDQVLPALTGLFTIVVAAAFFLRSGQARLATSSFVEGTQPNTFSEARWAFVAEFIGIYGGVTGAPNGLTEGLGWLDTPVHTGTWVIMLGAVAALAFIGFAHLNWRKALALAALTALAVAMPAKSLLQLNALPGELFQPRYILPVLMVIFGLLLLVGPGKRITLTVWQLLVLWLGVTFAAALALHVWIRRWTTGLDVLGLDLTEGALWWTEGVPSPNVVWIMGSVAWSALIAIALLHFWPQRSASRLDVSKDDDLSGAHR